MLAICHNHFLLKRYVFSIKRDTLPYCCSITASSERSFSDHQKTLLTCNCWLILRRHSVGTFGIQIRPSCAIVGRSPNLFEFAAWIDYYFSLHSVRSWSSLIFSDRLRYYIFLTNEQESNIQETARIMTFLSRMNCHNWKRRKKNKTRFYCQF